MNASRKPAEDQLYIPGADPRPLRIASLKSEYPPPKTLEQAEKFFRKHCRVAIFQEDVSDILRVSLRQSDTNENKLKFEGSFTLPMRSTDPDEWELRYMEVAEKYHRYWMEEEEEKYR